MHAAAGLVLAAALIGLAPGGALAPGPAQALQFPPGGLAPEVRGAAGVVRWNAVGVEHGYRIAISDGPRGEPGRKTRYETIPRDQGEAQSYRPAEPLGEVVYVGVSADGGVLWSETEARVRVLPEDLLPVPGTESEELEEASEAEAAEEPANANAINALTTATAPVIIGTNGGSGWGSVAAKTIIAGHITWDRFSVSAWAPAVQTSMGYGFHMLAIVGNINDGTPISTVEPLAWGNTVAGQLAANPAIELAEAGNEIYLKGNIANPAQYARMYVAAVNALKAKGIKTPLLFNMIGDYPYGTWSSPKGWSEDAKGAGWLRDALKAAPGLGAAILANGVSMHPYGGLTQNVHDTYGVASVPAAEKLMREVLGAVPRIYITEFGYDLARCGQSVGACTRLEQASKLRAAYKAFEADPNVAGIWWYESHDDSTGMWGYMNLNDTKRPAFLSLSSFAKLSGQ